MSTEDGTFVPLNGERRTETVHLEPLSQRIFDYLPPRELLNRAPTAGEIQRRAEYRATRPSDEFALVYYEPEQRLIIVPSWHELNTTPKSANGSHYGTTSIETLTLEPVFGEQGTDQEGQIVGGNIILLDDRIGGDNARLYNRALPSRMVNFPIPRDVFSQGIQDLMAVLGPNVLVTPDGHVGIASIRVNVGPGAGKFGKSAIGQGVDASVEAYATQKSFPDSAYNGEGLVISAGVDQRAYPFRGKHASHYGEGGRIGEIAKDLGASDALFFAQYYAHDPRRTPVLSRVSGRNKLERTQLQLALANGLGAEIMAVRKEDDGSETLLLPPMDVNRLGGVTAQYIIDHLAPAMGIKTEIAPFSLQDVLDGKIVGLLFAGNAARVAAISTVRLHDGQGQPERDITLAVPKTTTRLIQQFEQEVRSLVPPSDASLITRVNFDPAARSILQDVYKDWMN